LMGDDDGTRILVRYGNVIYPVHTTNEIREKYKEIVIHLDRLRCNRDDYYIVFQAPPHSITVTPSRESLSMSGHTEVTLNILFDGFLNSLKTKFDKLCDIYAEISVKHAVDEAAVDQLLKREAKLPSCTEAFEPWSITDLDMMAKRYMVANYPRDLEFRKQDIKRRLTLMAEGGLIGRGIAQTYLRSLAEVKDKPQIHNWSGMSRGSDWLQKQVVGPLVSKLYKAGIDHKKLFVCDPEDVNVPDKHNRTNAPPLVPAVSAYQHHLFGALPYLRNIVVISCALRDLVSRAYEHEVFQELGKYPGYLFYQASRKAGEREAVLDFFKKSGMTVVDLTTLTVAPRTTQAQRYPTTAVSAPRKPAKKGLACMSSIIKNSGIDTSLSREDSAARITTPEFVVSIPVRKGETKQQLDNWDRISSRYIVDLIGSKGGITNNSAVHKKWMDNGAKDFKEYLQDKMCTHMLTSPGIQEYWAFNPKRLLEAHSGETRSVQKMVNLVYRNAEMRKEFQLVNNLTVEDQKYLYLWEFYTDNYWLTSDPVNKVKAHLHAIPMSPLNTVMLKQVKNNSLLRMIDTVDTIEMLNDPAVKPSTIKKAIEILIAILKN